MRHQVLCFSLSESLFNSALDTNETSTELVFCQFTDTTNASVTQVVDVIDLSTAVTQFDQHFDRVENILVRQGHRVCLTVRMSETAVDLHPSYAGQIVRLLAVKQTLEQRLDCVLCRWLTRTHHAVDCNTRRHLIRRFIRTKRLGNVRAAVQIVDEQSLNGLNTSRPNIGQ